MEVYDLDREVLEDRLLNCHAHNKRTDRVMRNRCNRFQMMAPTKPKMYPITAVITMSTTAAIR